MLNESLYVRQMTTPVSISAGRDACRPSPDIVRFRDADVKTWNGWALGRSPGLMPRTIESRSAPSQWTENPKDQNPM